MTDCRAMMPSSMDNQKKGKSMKGKEMMKDQPK
jgi:hypothetical protein